MALYGFARQTILNAIRRGEIRGKRVGTMYYVWDEAEIFPGKDPLESVPFIKLGEVAAILGISYRAVMYFVEKGKMRAQVVGGQHFTTIAELRKIVAMRANYNVHGKRKKHQRQSVIELVRQRLSGL